jgi:hypothetical protein
MNAQTATHDAAVQMIDTSIIRAKLDGDERHLVRHQPPEMKFTPRPAAGPVAFRLLAA